MRKNLNQKDNKKNMKRVGILLLLLIMCSANISTASSQLDSIPFNTLNNKKLADEADKPIPDDPVPLATVDLLGFPDPLVITPKEPEPLRSQRKKRGTAKKQTAAIAPAETKPEIVTPPAHDPVSEPTPAPVQIIEDADVPLAQPVINNITENKTVINYVESSDDNNSSTTSNNNTNTTNDGSNSPDTGDNGGSGTDDNNGSGNDNNNGSGNDNNNNPDTGDNSDSSDNGDADSMGYDKSVGAYNTLYERACALAEAFDSCDGDPDAKIKQNTLLETGNGNKWVGSNDQFRSKLLKDIGSWPRVTEDSDAVEAVKESHLFADINNQLEALENDENMDDSEREKLETRILKEGENILNNLWLNIYVIPPRNGAERQVILYVNRTGQEKNWNSDLIFDGSTWYETGKKSFNLANPLNIYNWDEFKILYMDGGSITLKDKTITGEVTFYELGSINSPEEEKIAPLALAAPALPLVNEIAPEITTPDEIIDETIIEDETLIDGEIIDENMNETDVNGSADNTTESPDTSALDDTPTDNSASGSDSADNNSSADNSSSGNNSSDNSSSDSSSPDSGPSDSSSSDGSSSDSNSSDSGPSDSSSSDGSSSDSNSSDGSPSDSSSSDGSSSDSNSSDTSSSDSSSSDSNSSDSSSSDSSSSDTSSSGSSSSDTSSSDSSSSDSSPSDTSSSDTNSSDSETN